MSFEDDELRLLLLTLTPDEILRSQVPSGIAQIARNVFEVERRELAVWACAPLIGKPEYWGTPAKWTSLRDKALTEWALKGLQANPGYGHLHELLGSDFAWTATEAMNACNRNGYTGTASTFALLAADDAGHFASAATLFYRPEKRDEAAATLLRDLCRFFYD